jgi:hypothetical protein
MLHRSVSISTTSPYIFGTVCLAELGGGFAVPPARSFFFTFLGCELLTERVGGRAGGAKAAAAALLEEAELLLPLLPPLPEKEKKEDPSLYMYMYSVPHKESRIRGF